MEYTTRFGLHSQATRLLMDTLKVVGNRTMYGIITLNDAPFQRTYALCQPSKVPLQTTILRRDYKFELIPVHSPLLGESLLVSFPPLINMLKFSG